MRHKAWNSRHLRLVKKWSNHSQVCTPHPPAQVEEESEEDSDGEPNVVHEEVPAPDIVSAAAPLIASLLGLDGVRKDMSAEWSQSPRI